MKSVLMLRVLAEFGSELGAFDVKVPPLDIVVVASEPFAELPVLDGELEAPCAADVTCTSATSVIKGRGIGIMSPSAAAPLDQVDSCKRLGQ